ncbi:putative ribonuclease H-like domain-containing protein [Tanacetum coccineum]
MKPFGCPVTILNIRDHLGKFDGKADEGFFVGYSVLFDVDSLTISMNYVPVIARNQTNGIAGTRDNIVAGAEKKTEPEQEYILIPFYITDPLISPGPKDSEEDVGMKPTEVNESGASDKGEADEQDTRINAAKTSEEHLFEQFYPFKNAFTLPDVPNVSPMDDNTRIFAGAYDDEDLGGQADLNNLETTMNVSSIPTTRINKDHPIELIIGDLHSALLTRRMSQQNLKEHCLVSYINKQRRTNHKDYQNYLFACFLSQKEPKKVIQALEDPSWIEAMQEELLQFELQKVWILVDLPNGMRNNGTKWVSETRKMREELIEAIRLFLAYASFIGFIVYQMDVKSAFLYGTIEEEVYVCQPPGFEDPHFPDKVYKVEKALYGLHQAPKAWYETLSTYLIENGFRRGTIDKTLFIKKDKGDILLVQVYVDDIIFGSTKKSLCDEFKGLMHKRFHMSSMGELTFFLGLQVQQKEDGIFISQDKYVAEILKKFDFATVKTVSTPIETNKALVKDEEAEAVDVHLYRSMIISLMYLTASRPDITFVVCACARFQVTLKVSHLHAVKRIFRYLKGQPKLGLWYPRDSPFDLKAFFYIDYAEASLDRKSTTGEYVVVANCCGQVLWIQNQMLDYGFNFMNTKIYIDNKSTICIMKNPVFHFKTKHIEIRHHFMRYSYEKKLIQVIKIHTDHNVADLLTKAFDMRLSIRSRETEWKGLLLLLLAKKQIRTVFWNTVHSQPISDVKQIHATIDGKTILISELLVRSDLHFNDEDGITCLTNDAIFDNLALMGVVRATTTAASLDAAKASGDRPRCQEAIGGVIAQTRYERASKHSYDSPLPGVNTPGSDEERIEHQELTDNIPPTPYDSPLSGGYTPGSDEGRPDIHELMAICTKLSDRVLDLEKEKDAQTVEILKLKNIIKKLERKAKSSIPPPKRRLYKQVNSSDDSLGEENASKHGRNDSNKTEEFNLSDKGSGGTEVFDDTTAAKKNVNAAEPVSTAGDAITAASVIPDIDICWTFTCSSIVFYIERAAGTLRPRMLLGVAEFDNVQATIEGIFYVYRSGLMGLVLWILRRVEKKAKSKDATEKEGLKAYLKIVPDEDRAVNYETLATKYPIVDWESQIIRSDLQGNDLSYWKITRADGSSKFYKVFSMMLEDFDRQDLVDLHRLVKERSASRALEGWKLYETCGVHTLLMDGTLVCINMLVEQKYPLTQEMLTRMLNWRLEADFENEMAYELIRKTVLPLVSPDHGYDGITPIKFPFPLKSSARAVGSCNGIMLVLDERDSIFWLWNPSIRRKLTIPEYPLREAYIFATGFAFDSVTEDYKIVTLSFNHEQNNDIPYSFVYTMKTRTWCQISNPITPSCYETTEGHLVNGVLHWVGPSVRLTTVNGSLAVITYGGDYARIWVRKESNTTPYWVSYLMFKLNVSEKVMPLSTNGYLLLNSLPGVDVYSDCNKGTITTCEIQRLF